MTALSVAVRLWWTAWSGRRHPALLLFMTAVAAFVALVLLIGVSNTPVVLYKEF